MKKSKPKSNKGREIKVKMWAILIKTGKKKLFIAYGNEIYKTKIRAKERARDVYSSYYYRIIPITITYTLPIK